MSAHHIALGLDHKNTKPARIWSSYAAGCCAILRKPDASGLLCHYDTYCLVKKKNNSRHTSCHRVCFTSKIESEIQQSGYFTSRGRYDFEECNKSVLWCDNKNSLKVLSPSPSLRHCRKENHWGHSSSTRSETTFWWAAMFFFFFAQFGISKKQCLFMASKPQIRKPQRQQKYRKCRIFLVAFFFHLHQITYHDIINLGLPLLSL